MFHKMCASVCHVQHVSVSGMELGQVKLGQGEGSDPGGGGPFISSLDNSSGHVSTSSHCLVLYDLMIPGKMDFPGLAQVRLRMSLQQLESTAEGSDKPVTAGPYTMPSHHRQGETLFFSCN